jgi:uncharacterized protein YukE
MSARVAQALDLEAQLGALGAEIAGVLRPLLAPLLEKWEWVTGDDEQVLETARRWRAMSEALSQVAHDEEAAAARVVGEWEGLAQQSFDQAVDDVVRDLKEVAVRTGDVADLLEEAAVAVRRAEQIVRDLIRELIEWAAMSLAISAAGAIITLGASAAAGAAAAAAKAGIVGARIAAQLSQLAVELRRIQLLLGVYQSWIKSLGFAQKRLVSTVQAIVVKSVTPLDGKWKQPAIDLAHIQVEPERCFEEPSAGPRW